LKLLGFTTIRLENNKLAYKYDIPSTKGIHPIMEIIYDELRQTLANN
jgi:hypothetical protein